MAELRRYTPTVGMLRALTDAKGADALDYYRCRVRGLVTVDLYPNGRGREVIQREIRRRAEVRHGR